MNRLNRRIALIGTVFFLISLLISAVALTPDGEALFREQRCNTCHRLKGHGGMLGPDLSDVIKRRGIIWTIRQIRNPKSHNPVSRMPSYDHLGYIETYAIISYLKP